MVRPTRAAVESLVPRDGERKAWFVGDDVECAVIDPAGSLGELLSRCDSRRLSAILWTSLWPGSVGNAVALADRTGAVTYLDADDLVIWQQAEPERRPQCLVPQAPPCGGRVARFTLNVTTVQNHFITCSNHAPPGTRRSSEDLLRRGAWRTV